MNYLWGSGFGKGNAHANPEKKGESDLSEDTHGRTVSASFGNGPTTFGQSAPAPKPTSSPAFDYSAVPSYTPPIPSGIPFQSPYLNVGQIDPAILGQSKVSSNDFLFEGQKDKRRPFYEQMVMGIAAAYMGGHAVGGTWGFVEGIRHPAATTTRLKINTVLNAVTKRGPALGNAAGVVACMFGGINYGLNELREDDDINGIVSAVGAGALFKCTAGPRAIALASTTAGVLYVMYAVARSLVRGESITKPVEVLREKQYD